MTRCQYCNRKIGLFEFSLNGLHTSCLKKIETIIDQTIYDISESQVICLSTLNYSILKSHTDSIITSAQKLKKYEPLNILSPTPSEIIQRAKTVYQDRAREVLIAEFKSLREMATSDTFSEHETKQVSDFIEMVKAITDLPSDDIDFILNLYYKTNEPDGSEKSG